jgi:hypothetical protein
MTGFARVVTTPVSRNEKGAIMAPFSCQFGQTRDLAAGGCFVNDALGGCLVDKGYGALQGGLCFILVTGGDRSPNLFDKSAHAAANMRIAGVAYRGLTVSFQSGFVVSQGVPPFRDSMDSGLGSIAYQVPVEQSRMLLCSV